MISTDIETDVKQETKKLVAVSCDFSQKYLLKTCGWHSIQPGVKVLLRKGQNLLSMTKSYLQRILYWLVAFT